MTLLRYITLIALFLCMLVNPARLTAEEQTWTINLKDVDIRVLVTQVADITGESYIVDPDLQGKVTVLSSTPLNKEGVKELFLTVLRVHGFAAVPTGDVTVILKQANVSSSGSEFDPMGNQAGEQLVTRVIPIMNAPVTELINVLRPMIPRTSYIEAASYANALIITDRAENIHRITRIIAHLDLSESDEVEIIPLKEAWVGSIVPVIETLAPSQLNKENKGYSRLRMVADERSNSLILKGEASERARMRALIEKLDRPANHTGSTQVIRLRHADASDMITTLKELITDKEGTSIQADEALNALVVRAQPSAMSEIKAVVAQLDVRRPQVLIEAAIVEITDDLSKRLGIQLSGGDAVVEESLVSTSFSTVGASLSSIIASLETGKPSTTIGDGLTGALGRKDKFGVLLQALSTSTKANLLSTPSITTLDNEEAKIVVGQNVPFRTGSFDEDGDGTNPFTTIEREDIGITLKVIPQIHQGDLVRLTVEQEVSSLEETTQSGAADIITNKRTIETTILANDNETVTLGGLIRDDINVSETKVPLLGDIPILGHLFRSKKNTQVKRNLLVFLRPTILRDVESMDNITQEKYTGIWELQLEHMQETGDLNEEMKSLEPTPINRLYDINGRPWLRETICKDNKELCYKWPLP